MRGFNQEDQVISAFGSLSWNVTDRLKLNTGLRGSWVEKDFTGYLVYGTGSELYGGMVPFPDALQLVAPLVGQPGEAFSKGRYDAWMPSGGLQFELRPEVLSYVSYSRGFKAGGFNPLDAAASTVVPNNGAYDPEYVHAYEAGLKSKWFDDSLLINVAVFLSDYEDLQVTTLEFQPLTGTYTASVRNAAKSRSQGVELEIEVGRDRSAGARRKCHVSRCSLRELYQCHAHSVAAGQRAPRAGSFGRAHGLRS